MRWHAGSGRHEILPFAPRWGKLAWPARQRREPRSISAKGEAMSWSSSTQHHSRERVRAVAMVDAALAPARIDLAGGLTDEEDDVGQQRGVDQVRAVVFLPYVVVLERSRTLVIRQPSCDRPPDLVTGGSPVPAGVPPVSPVETIPFFRYIRHYPE